jgi:hypothetical protein
MRIIFIIVLFIQNLISYSQTINFIYDNSGNRLSKSKSYSLPLAAIEYSASFEDTILICQNSLATFTAQGGTQFLWQNGITNQNFTVLASQPQELTCIVTNDAGCSDTASIFVEIIPNPTPITGNFNVTGGQSYTYAVPLFENVFYNWQITNGVIINGFGTNQVTVEWFSGETNGNLSVFCSEGTEFCQQNIVTQSIGISTSVEETDAPTIAIYPNPSIGEVTLNFDSFRSERSTLTVFDVQGKKVYYRDFIAGLPAQIVLSKEIFASSGPYYLSTEQSQTIINRTIIILKDEK